MDAPRTEHGERSAPQQDRRPNPLVFLSSTVRGIRDERRELHEYGRRYGNNAVWVDEVYRESSPVGGTATGTHERWGSLDLNPFPDIDDYLKELRRSQLYVAWIATERVGSSLELAHGARAIATFFELELAYAAVLGRPIAIVRVRGVQPEPKLAYLLGVVSRTLHVHEHEADSIRDSVAIIRGIIDGVACGEDDHREPGRTEYGLFLADRWTLRRESLRWLSNDWPSFPDHPEPDPVVVSKAIGELSSAATAEQRLARLWIAVREVMCSPYNHADPARQHEVTAGLVRQARDWLDAWNRVLTAWNGAAAWYGLHGHLELGYLAALNSLADIRRIAISVDPARQDDPAWDPPNPALASAYYAAARRVSAPTLRLRGLLKARRLLKTARYRDAISKSNGLAILGSVDLQLGNIPGGLWAYRKVLRLRERATAPAAAIGEAMAELGYAYARIPGIRSYGIALLRRGIAVMEGAHYEAGFIVRAKYKLADALNRAGSETAARRVKAEALALAQQSTIGFAARDYSDPNWSLRGKM